MNRRRAFVGVAIALLVALAGCGGVKKSNGVSLYNPTTEIEADGQQAVWTWSADIDPPEEGYCDIKVDITLYNESGGVVGTKTQVVKNVDTSGTRHSISYIGEPEEINSIVTYETEFSEPQC